MISSKLRDMNLVHLNRLIRKKVHGANTIQKASILLKRLLVEFIFIAFNGSKRVTIDRVWTLSAESIWLCQIQLNFNNENNHN